MPSGQFLMEDFYYAGGLPAVMRELGENGLLEQDALTVTGRTIGDNVKTRRNWNTDVIRPLDKPVHGPRAGSPCCAATSRRTARSSSPRPPRRR